MSVQAVTLEVPTIGQQCKVWHLPAVAARCAQHAEQAVRERRQHLGFLEALLQAELEEREQRLIARRIREASATNENAGPREASGEPAQDIILSNKTSIYQ
jgi:hypothetical protein